MKEYKRQSIKSTGLAKTKTPADQLGLNLKDRLKMDPIITIGYPTKFKD